jgi:V/A-type H+/Na+-transporting ATPase subunit I
MIVAMMKYSFLVYHAEYKAFLKELKNMGVLHIEVKKHEPTAEIQDLLRAYNDLSRTLRNMENRVKDKEIEGDQPAFDNGEAVLERIHAIEGELELKQQQISNLDKEAQQLGPWGDFNPQRVQQLKDSQLFLRFLVCRDKNFNPQWEKEQYLKVISSVGGFTYFVLIEKDQRQEMIDWPGVDELSLPQKSLSALRKVQTLIAKEIHQLENELDLIAKHCQGQLQSLSDQLKSELDETNALYQTQDEVEERVKLIEGWVPKPKTEELNAYLEEKNILYVAKKPSDDEKVPVLLKNNKFARLFEVIGDLYELPNHKELDLVPFFAPFYMMFFGFSLGDAGYGLLILGVAFWLKPRMPAMKNILGLAQWLGLATVIFGILTGTFFGMDLVNAEIPWLEGFKKYMITKENMFNLALILGVIQILFGMVLKVINIYISKGFAYAYSTIGWLILLIGSGSIYLLKHFGALGDTIGGYAQNAVFIASGVLILLLNHPRRSIVMNFLSGLWDVYGMVTGLIGDLLSYIRLFALGVSSAILGFVFNELAMSLSPDHIILGPLVMIIILVVGHGMTLFMAGLGAFVHPIRLTFVEFYKNAGFTGGGKRYTPFAEKSVE